MQIGQCQARLSARLRLATFRLVHLLPSQWIENEAGTDGLENYLCSYYGGLTQHFELQEPVLCHWQPLSYYCLRIITLSGESAGKRQNPY